MSTFADIQPGRVARMKNDIPAKVAPRFLALYLIASKPFVLVVDYDQPPVSCVLVWARGATDPVTLRCDSIDVLPEATNV